MQRLILLAAVALALIGSIGVSAQTFNVKDYGATGDGTTDDSLAVAKACTALQASLTGGELFFPDGNYNLDNAHVESYIYITGQNSSLQYNVRGESTDSTILMPNLGASGFALITLNLLDPNVTSVSTHFSNFTVQLLAPSGNNFDAISFWAVVDSSIRGVNFNATGPVDSIFDINAYNNGSFADPRGIIFEDCNFSGTTRDSVDIEGPGISNIEFRRCSFSLDPSITPPFQVQGVRLGDRITNVVFDSCEFSGLNTGFVTYASSTTYEPSQKSITVISSSFYNTLIGIWIKSVACRASEQAVRWKCLVAHIRCCFSSASATTPP